MGRTLIYNRFSLFFFFFLNNITTYNPSRVVAVLMLPISSGGGFEAKNSINFLGQSILFHNLLSFTL